MIDPLSVFTLDHCTFAIYGPDEHHAKGLVVTTFPDGLTVPAAPNGDEALIDTALHELSHHLVAQLRYDCPSACLRGVAEGHGRKWDDAKHEEESSAYKIGMMLSDLHKALMRNKDGLE